MMTVATRNKAGAGFYGYNGATLAMLLGLGVALSLLLALGSWKLYLAAAGGLVVGSLIMLRPRVGLYFTAATVPLDAAGRLGDLLPNINISLAKVFVALTFLAWLLDFAMQRRRIIWARELSILGLYLAIGIFSLADTQEFKLGYQAVIRLAASILFYFLVVNLIQTRKHLLRTVTILATVSVLTFGFAVVQRYLPSMSFQSRAGWDESGAQRFGVEMHDLDAGKFGTVARSTGVTYHAIIVAVNTNIFFPILVGALVFARNQWRRRVLWVGILICLAGNLSAHSRTGFLLLFMTVGLLLVYRILKITPLRIMVVALALTAAIPFIPETLLHRVLSPESYTLTGSESLRQRLSLLKAGAAAFLDHPVNGMGIETTYRIYDYYDYEDKTAIVTVHNGYLQVALELGIAGIAVLLLFLGRLLMSFQKAAVNFKKRGDPQMAVMSLCLFISIVIFMFAGLTIDFMRIGFKNVWLLWALAPVMFRLSTRQEGKLISMRQGV